MEPALIAFHVCYYDSATTPSVWGTAILTIQDSKTSPRQHELGDAGFQVTEAFAAGTEHKHP